MVGKIVGWVVIIALVVWGIFALQSDGTPTEGGPIKIGWIGPLSGDTASIGEPLRNAVAMAVSEINTNGGVDGRELDVIYEDGLCDAKGGTNAAQKLIGVDGVKFIIGGACSGETLGAAPIAEENKVILFSTASGSPDITDAGDYIFRNFPSDASSASKVALAAFDGGFSTASLLIENTDFTQALARVFKDSYGPIGGIIDNEESFDSDRSDFRTELTKIKSDDSDSVYIAAYPEQVSRILKQLEELKVDKQILTNESVAATDVLESFGDVLEGVLYAEPLFDLEESTAKEYLNRYAELYGGLPTSLPPVYIATAYDAVYILAELFAEHGTDVEAVKNGLYEIEDRKGVAGLLTIDENGDPLFEYVLKTIKDGEVADYTTPEESEE